MICVCLSGCNEGFRRPLNQYTPFQCSVASHRTRVGLQLFWVRVPSPYQEKSPIEKMTTSPLFYDILFINRYFTDVCVFDSANLLQNRLIIITSLDIPSSLFHTSHLTEKGQSNIFAIGSCFGKTKRYEYFCVIYIFVLLKICFLIFFQFWLKQLCTLIVSLGLFQLGIPPSLTVLCN